MKNKAFSFIVAVFLITQLSSCFVEAPYYGPYRNYHYGYSVFWWGPHYHSHYSHGPRYYGGHSYRGGYHGHGSSYRGSGHYR